ncbi:MAG: hypothetical protein ACI4DO_02300 [Roseburia sp.]
MKEEQEYQKALATAKVPVLVLDQKWHQLFALSGKPEPVLSVEKELNHLLERQGKLNTDIKDLKKTKSKLMENIVQNMEGTHEENINDISSKKLSEDRRLIDEINQTIESYEDELLDIPRQIHETNNRLMLATMDFCYDTLRLNKEQIEEIGLWIAQVRIDLKKNIIKKQNREINNKQIYSYMHDIFGAQILDLFDLKTEDEEKYKEKAKKEKE